MKSFVVHCSVLFAVCLLLKAEEDTLFAVFNLQGEIIEKYQKLEMLPAQISEGQRVVTGNIIETGLGDFFNVAKCKNSDQWGVKSQMNFAPLEAETVIFSMIEGTPAKGCIAIIIEADSTWSPISNGIFQLFPATGPSVRFKDYPKGNYILVILMLKIPISNETIVSTKAYPSYLNDSKFVWKDMQNVIVKKDKLISIINSRLLNK